MRTCVLAMAPWATFLAFSTKLAWATTVPRPHGRAATRATCLPAISSYTASITLSGCYTDSTTRSLAGVEFTTVTGGNTPQNCANLCGASGYTYAGVEYSSECYCGTSIGSSATLGTTADCSYTCSGDASQMCGGNYFIDIYKIANLSGSATTTTSNGLPDCTRDPLCSLSICDTSLSTTARVAGLVSSMTLAEKAANMQNAAVGVSRLGLPAYQWWSEALHGVASGHGVAFASSGNWSSATSFPMPILTAAAFDDALVKAVATVIGTEGRAFANHGKAGFDFWTPNINPFKDPRWGRGMETPGEDAYRVAQYTLHQIDGLQGGIDPAAKLVIATCKHYAVYDVEGGRGSYDYNPTNQELQEYYMSPFKTCARDAKAGAFMCSYNAVDGTPTCANRYLLQTMLREHWGWSQPYQWVTSDCGAITNIQNGHGYTSTIPDAAAAAVNAGTDLACESGTVYTQLTTSVSAGTITTASIDKAISRLYASLVNVGYFGTGSSYASLDWSNVNTAAAQQLAYNAASEGMTLLKNDGTLPLPKSPTKVVVIGPWATATTQMQGNYYGKAPFLTSPLAALQASWSGVTYFQGTTISGTDTSGFAAALAGAASATYIIYCGGIDTTIEAESLDRTTIVWPGNQLSLISQLAALGKKLVVVQFGGGQLDDTSLLSNSGVNSILWAGYPGQAGGSALRDVLDGARSVAGRLPITQYPASYTGAVAITNPALRPNSANNPGRTYSWYSTPVLPFGYGLHYTNFTFAWGSVPSATYAISSLVSAASTPIDTTPFATVTAKVTNAGGAANMFSDYVGLLFISTKNGGPSPYPRKTLVSYNRLFNITVGSAGTLSLPLTIGSLARTDVNGSLVLYPGTYTLTLDNAPSLTYSFALTGVATVIETVPMPQTTAPPSVSFLGCYTDSATSRTLNGVSTTDTTTNSVDKCATTCKAGGYAYAGVQYGRECWCANSVTSTATLTDGSSCNYACTGQSQATCGGNYFIDVYKITPAVIIQKPTFS